MAGSDRGQGGADCKKLIERDALADLMAFYAPRGIAPEIIRQMSPADRAVLRVGRARWYEEMAKCTQYGVASALTPPKEDKAYGEQE